jgi:hypothetical protein
VVAYSQMLALHVHAPGAIHSYAGRTAWEDADPQAGTYVIRVRSPGGRVTTRPERADVDDPLNPDPDALPFDLGPERSGRSLRARAARRSSARRSSRRARWAG